MVPSFGISVVGHRTPLARAHPVHPWVRFDRSITQFVADAVSCRTLVETSLEETYSFRPGWQGPADLEWDMNSLRQVQPHGSSSSSSRRPTPSRPSKPAKTLVVFACRPRFSTSYSHHCKGLPLCIGWPSPAYRMVFVTMASLTRQFGREYPQDACRAAATRARRSQRSTR